jgi:hypothetical protein
MKKIIFLFSILSSSFLFSQNLTLDWVKSVGGINLDFASDINFDNSGNLLIAGQFNNTVDFDPSSNIINETSQGSSDIFFGKYDLMGNLIFIKTISGASAQYIRGIKGDDLGNIYLIGLFQGLTDFDPSSSSYNLTPIGLNDIFFAKYTSTGDLIYVKQLGNNAQEDVNDFFIDNNEITLAGTYQLPFDFNPSTTSDSIINPSNNTTHGFISKYTSNGDFIFARSIEGNSHIFILYLDLDKNNNIYVSGKYGADTDFDPSPINSYTLGVVGSEDWFFAKYNITGDLIFAKSFQSDGIESIQAMDVDSTGNIYLCGYIQFNTGPVDFDPSSNINSISTQGITMPYMVKYDNQGDFVFVNAFETNAALNFQDIKIINENRILTTGFYQGTVDFNPNSTFDTLKSQDFLIYETFIASYETNGNFQWAVPIYGNQNSVGKCIIEDLNSNIYITGTFDGTCDFDLSSSTNSSTSNGNSDLYLAKYTNNSTSLYFENKINSCAVFPNPFSNNITIKHDNSANSISFYDQLGKLVLKTTMSKDGEIDTSNLPEGFYTIEIKTNETIVKDKVVKIKN